MQNSLTTTSGGGTQTTTQDPQAATSDSNLNPSQGSLQSSSVNLFNNTNGVSLNPTSLPTVKLQASQSNTISQPIQAPKHHHINGILLGIAIVVFIAALAIFWQTTLAAKSTTD